MLSNKILSMSHSPVDPGGKCVGITPRRQRFSRADMVRCFLIWMFLYVEITQYVGTFLEHESEDQA
jgi:hypothetical protein